MGNENNEYRTRILFIIEQSIQKIPILDVAKVHLIHIYYLKSVTYLYIATPTTNLHTSLFGTPRIHNCLSIKKMDSSNEQKKGGILVGNWDEMKGKLMKAIKVSKKVGKDDPRRIIHSMKVGLALTLASYFFYFRPLYNGFQGEGMWAILTVVVVFEFTVGQFNFHHLTLKKIYLKSF